MTAYYTIKEDSVRMPDGDWMELAEFKKLVPALNQTFWYKGAPFKLVEEDHPYSFGYRERELLRRNGNLPRVLLFTQA